jgi:oxygen-independent coproporphyrinogen III oxidase
MAEFLYIHIPFCARKCLYCDFLSIPHESVLAERYIDALCTELTLRKRSIGPLRTIYVGGGTPSILSDRCLRRLFACLNNSFHFLPGVEITVEANPGTLTTSGMQTLLAAGVNRLSIGVQSLNDGELRTLGRLHSGNDAERSAELIRRSGVGNYSIDLMYGIPGQTLGTWSQTLSAAIGLSPSHISAYELTPEKGTPIFDLISSGTLSLPDEEKVIEMYEYTINCLSAAGYDHYEISNFGLPGAQCLHNLNYWDRGDYAGAGAGAHSFMDGVRTANTGDIGEYIARLNDGSVPAGAAQAVSQAEASREFLFLGLRKRRGIEAKEAAEMGMDIVSKGREMFDEGYLVLEGDHIRLTGKGLVISNTVIVRLFELLGL